MASFLNGQDKPNHAAIGYPSGQDAAIVPAGDYPLALIRIINPLLTKFVSSR